MFNHDRGNVRDETADCQLSNDFSKGYGGPDLSLRTLRKLDEYSDRYICELPWSRDSREAYFLSHDAGQRLGEEPSRLRLGGFYTLDTIIHPQSCGGVGPCFTKELLYLLYFP